MGGREWREQETYKYCGSEDLSVKYKKPEGNKEYRCALL